MNIITKTENAEMYFANTVRLVEGGEKYIIKRLIEIKKDNLFLDYNNISIIKVGGKTYFSIYKKMLEKLGKKVFIIGDYDNFKQEVNEFLDNEKLKDLNNIKSKGGLKKYSDYKGIDKNKFDALFEYLKNKGIYILHNGALEDYYNNEQIDSIKQENNISGKEVVAHYISTVLDNDNKNTLLSIENDFNDYIDDIINKI